MNVVTPEIYEQRIDICKNCDMLNEEIKMCKRCGCFVYIKARIVKSKCPLDKWNETIINTPKGQ